MADFHKVTINDDTLIRGAARLLIAGTTISFPSTISQVINLSTYDPMSGWTDLGATKGGIQISVNSSDEALDVDQIYGELQVSPTGWECSVQTSLAQSTLESMQFAWEGSDITTDSGDGAGTKSLTVGAPLAYTKRRMAVIHQKANGKLRAHIFRQVIRASQESTLNYAKSGDQQTIPVRFRALADISVTDARQRFFLVREQV